MKPTLTEKLDRQITVILAHGLHKWRTFHNNPWEDDGVATKYIPSSCFCKDELDEYRKYVYNNKELIHYSLRYIGQIRIDSEIIYSR